MYRGIATFTLDYGKCPPWLFERMVRLGREMIEIIVREYGAEEFIRRLADPAWFQSLGTVLAFDWNASGLTTILTAALKEAIRYREKELGIFVCGGKGKTSRKTPDQITFWSEAIGLPNKTTQALVYNSRMAAKVDSALVQDGFQIYHHTFFFSKSGAWTVVQQGMNVESQTARRYHWFSKNVKDLVCEPHTGISSQTSSPTLNLVAKESEKTRTVSAELVNAGYAPIMKEMTLVRKHYSALHKMAEFQKSGDQLKLLFLENTEFDSHPAITENFAKSKYLEKILYQVCEQKPRTYEELLAQSGVGPKTMRALALVGEVVYGARPSYEDPARYSFAHGGKDATPFPIDRATYDTTIEFMKKIVDKMKISVFEKQKIVQRLGR